MDAHAEQDVTGPQVTLVTVERVPGGAHHLRWVIEGGGDGTEVEVSAGTRPDAIDHDRPVARSATGGAVVEGLDPSARHYFHVAPAGGVGMVAAERLVSFEGTMNFRDLGGYPATGGHTRWGLVFRSDNLAGLTDADLEALGGLGLRVVHDFRYDEEREKAPTRVAADAVEHVAIPIGGAAAEHVGMLEQILAGEIESIGEEFMAELYLDMVDNEAASFGRLLTSLAGPDRLPALFHCTAGKDRTGLAAALLLGLLGTPDDVVIEDYELTNRYRAARRIEELRPRFAEVGVDVENFRAFLGAPRRAMEAALAHLHERYGSVEDYLRGPAGVSGADCERLRELLVSP